MKANQKSWYKTMNIPRKIMKTNQKYWKTIKNIVNIVNACCVQIVASVARVRCVKKHRYRIA